MTAPLLSPHEDYRLNRLIGQALAHPEIAQRLLTRDASLICEFALSPRLWALMQTVQASSVQDWCTAFVAMESAYSGDYA
ncbi:MAG: hypothetical protein AAFQ07_02725 [Chloroflexota bacterium]